MGYITPEEYRELCPLTPVPQDELPALIEKSSDTLDIITMYKIPLSGGIGKFPDFTQNQVKKATAAEVETIFSLGGVSVWTGEGADTQVNSATIGKFSYSNSSRNSTNGTVTGYATVNGVPVAPTLQGYLAPTGLLYGGMGCGGWGVLAL